MSKRNMNKKKQKQYSIRFHCVSPFSGQRQRSPSRRLRRVEVQRLVRIFVFLLIGCNLPVLLRNDCQRICIGIYSRRAGYITLQYREPRKKVG